MSATDTTATAAAGGTTSAPLDSAVSLGNQATKALLLHQNYPEALELSRQAIQAWKMIWQDQQQHHQQQSSEKDGDRVGKLVLIGIRSIAAMSAAAALARSSSDGGGAGGGPPSDGQGEEWQQIRLLFEDTFGSVPNTPAYLIIEG
jgi:hypothetical protein